MGRLKERDSLWKGLWRSLPEEKSDWATTSKRSGSISIGRGLKGERSVASTPFNLRSIIG